HDDHDRAGNPRALERIRHEAIEKGFKIGRSERRRLSGFRRGQRRRLAGLCRRSGNRALRRKRHRRDRGEPDQGSVEYTHPFSPLFHPGLLTLAASRATPYQGVETSWPNRDIMILIGKLSNREWQN